MVCTGAKSEDDSEKATRQYAKSISKATGQKEIKVKDFKIQNIVGSHDVNFNIKLESLNNAVRKGRKDTDDCNYDPEQFPGLIFRMKQPKVVLLIFNSGKIVLTGAKERE